MTGFCQHWGSLTTLQALDFDERELALSHIALRNVANSMAELNIDRLCNIWDVCRLPHTINSCRAWLTLSTQPSERSDSPPSICSVNTCLHRGDAGYELFLHSAYPMVVVTDPAVRPAQHVEIHRANKCLISIGKIRVVKKADGWLAICMGTIALIIPFLLSLPAKTLRHTDLHDI